MIILLPVLALVQLCILNANCLIDWPLFTRLSQNAIFHATLTDEATGDSFNIKEYIIETGVLASRIEITSKRGKAEVYYNDDNSNGLGEYQRLVIQDGRCDIYTYKIFWNQNLLDTEKPLTNLVLLLGPSLLYRINDADPRWEKGNDENVRGVRLHSSHASIDKTLNVTYYYKTLGNSEEDDREKPRRIVLEGTDPLGSMEAEDEKLIMDFHMQLETYDSLEKLVEVTPGVGCPIYLSRAKPFPKLKSHRISMVIHETINGLSHSSTNQEFYVNEDEAVLRRISPSSGINAVYDYNLGLVFALKDSECSMSPLDDKAPWLDEKKHLSLNHFLWLNAPFKYLGKIYLDYESKYVVNAWEAVEYNSTLEGTQCDKVVTTLYFVNARESDIFEGYSLVGSNRNCHAQNSNNGYTIVKVINRKFYEMKSVSFDNNSVGRSFSLDRCFPSRDSRVTLAYRLKYIEKVESPETFPDQFRQNFKSQILMNHKISPLRVLDIDFVFDPQDVIVYATFSDSPKIEDSFKKETLNINLDYLKKFATNSIESETECLRFHAKMTRNIRKVIHCKPPKSPSKCYRVETADKIIEDKINGYNCSVFDVPLGNLIRVDQELELKQIYPQMIKKSIKSIELAKNKFKIIKVIDVTQSDAGNSLVPFILSHTQTKLTNEAMQLIDAKNLGDCYRSCVKAGQSVCQSFSFCEYSDQVVCLAANTLSQQIVSDNVTRDVSCNTYSKNYLLNYFKIRERRFRVSPSIAQKVPLQNCAASCYSTNDCYSFQYCNGLCTFAGYYTDSSTEHYTECDIYSPKKSHLYRMTGHRISTESLHTEINLNMDQCASLCYDWKSGDETCQSFGYCFEGETPSICLLSKNTANNDRSSIVNNSTCYTYELTNINRSTDNQNAAEASRYLTSVQAVGIILSLAFGGLIIGLVAQKLTSKIKFNRNFPSFNQFHWSRQTDTDDI